MRSPRNFRKNLQIPKNIFFGKYYVLRQTLLFSKGQFLLFSLFFSFFPNISHLTLHFLPLFLQFSLRISHHRVKSNENLRSAIWKLRGSFFLPLVQPISASKRTNRKKQGNKDKGRKKWNDADVSAAFSAQNPHFMRFY